MLSIFASLKFHWPPALLAIYNSISVASFNLDLLAPECSISVSFKEKWLLTMSLPLLLLMATTIVVNMVRALQCVQRRVLKRLPFGAMNELDLTDVSVGIVISGLYYLYFRK